LRALQALAREAGGQAAQGPQRGTALAYEVTGISPAGIVGPWMRDGTVACPVSSPSRLRRRTPASGTSNVMMKAAANPKEAHWMRNCQVELRCDMATDRLEIAGLSHAYIGQP
jgi:hypothetical protein